jgi:hypothetical protein
MGVSRRRRLVDLVVGRWPSRIRPLGREEVGLEQGKEKGLLANTRDVVVDTVEVEFLARTNSAFDPRKIEAKYRKYKIQVDTMACPSRRRHGAEAMPSCAMAFDLIPREIVNALAQAGVTDSEMPNDMMIQFRLLGKTQDGNSIESDYFSFPLTLYYGNLMYIPLDGCPEGGVWASSEAEPCHPGQDGETLTCGCPAGYENVDGVCEPQS